MSAQPATTARKRNSREGKEPAFLFYASDWLSDFHVRSMTASARGIYIDLLAFCWREGSIPSDPPSLAHAVGVSLEEMETAWSSIVGRFEDAGRGTLRHRKLAGLRAERVAYIQAQSERAKDRERQKRMNKDIARPASCQLGSTEKQSASASASASVFSLSEPSEVQAEPRAQTPPEVRKGPTPEPDPPRPNRDLSASEKAIAVSAGLTIKAIERHEARRNGDQFAPGQWWGHARKERRHLAPMAETLSQLLRRLEAKDRPENPWAYCETTYREKRANYFAAAAETQSKADKQEPAVDLARLVEVKTL